MDFNLFHKKITMGGWMVGAKVREGDFQSDKQPSLNHK